MPLSNDSQYGVRAMTAAINNLPATPSIIRESGLFKPDYLSTTTVTIEARGGILQLVPNVPRGTPGNPVANAVKGKRYSFEMTHLPKHDVVRADDVQNLRGFGSDNKAATVAEVVNDKLADMKNDIEYTREHLMLGALQGKILDADGAPIVDIYERFGLTRKVFSWDLAPVAANVGKLIDAALRTLRKQRGDEPINGWICYCSPEFLEAVIYHKTVTAIYERYQDGAMYRKENTGAAFEHKGVTFVEYDHVFESGLQIASGEAYLAPKGTRNTFREYFAPADTAAAVNTKALAYYASREKMPHDKGWDLEAQSNPLPIVQRPNLVATLKLA